MHFEIGVWKTALDLFADEEIGGIGMIVEKLEAAVDAVVIGDRHDVHAAGLRGGIDRRGLGIAVARAQKPQVSGVAGMIRVQMEVRSQHASVIGRHSGFSSKTCSTVEPAPRYTSGRMLLPKSTCRIVFRGVRRFSRIPVPVTCRQRLSV